MECVSGFASPKPLGRPGLVLLEKRNGSLDPAEVDEVPGQDATDTGLLLFEGGDGLLGASSVGQQLGDGPGCVPGSTLGMRSRLLNRLLAQATRDHQRQPHPMEFPILSATAHLEGIKVGQAVLGAPLVGVVGAEHVDDPVLRAAG